MGCIWGKPDYSDYGILDEYTVDQMCRVDQEARETFVVPERFIYSNIPSAPITIPIR
jgi:hypothetical protein